MMRMMHRAGRGPIGATLLAAALTVGLAACGGAVEKSDASPSPAPLQASPVSPSAAPSPANPATEYLMEVRTQVPAMQDETAYSDEALLDIALRYCEVFNVGIGMSSEFAASAKPLQLLSSEESLVWQAVTQNSACALDPSVLQVSAVPVITNPEAVAGAWSSVDGKFLFLASHGTWSYAFDSEFSVGGTWTVTDSGLDLVLDSGPINGKTFGWVSDVSDSSDHTLWLNTNAGASNEVSGEFTRSLGE